jgi:AcrR family transcriptional regulator
VNATGADAEEDSTPLRPLHGGRHSLSPELVAYNQRERLLAALAATVAEHGYAKATVAQVTAAASVSRRTFYENFEDKEECFLAAYDALDDYLASLMEEAATEGEWPQRVAATFSALLGFFASGPNFARLYLVEAAAVGEAMASRRASTAERFIALLEPGRSYRGEGRDLAEGIEEALVGGIVTLLARRILGGEGAELGRFTPAVVEFALAPYLGIDAARRVAGAPPAA